MKIVLTGAGGGHFYPLIAVAERLKEETEKAKIMSAELFFMSDKEYNKELLQKNNISFIQIPSGKLRLYFSLNNLLDPFKNIIGFIKAFFYLFKIYPDVVFSKGGYASLPVIFAAKILFIPIFVHESDSVPGKTNLIGAKFAKRVAISYASGIKYFDKKKTAYTGQPIMKSYIPTKEDLSVKILNYKNKKESTNGKRNILVIGGSQGSEIINNIVIEALPELLKKYNVIHQVGEANYNTIHIGSEVLLKNNPNRENYHYFAFGDLSKYYETCDLCITRAGSTLFELSAWGIPSVIIPITNSNSNHQMINAYTFSDSGCSVVIEETNLTRSVLENAISSILDDDKKYIEMKDANIKAFKPDAAEIIAKEIIRISLSHI